MKIRLFILFLILFFFNISNIFANTKILTYTDHEWIITVNCSDYPNYTEIKLTVNWTSWTITCTPPDTTKPIWTVSYNPTWWTKNNVTINVTCTDPWWSWCKKSTYSKIVSSNDSWTIPIKDKAWNTTNITYNVTNIDKKTPTISLKCTNESITNSSVTCNASMSNKWPSKDTLKYTHSTTWWKVTWNWTTNNGNNITYNYTNNWSYIIELDWSDEAWNTTNKHRRTFKIDTSKPSISTNEDFNKWYNNTSLKNYIFSLKDQRNSTNNSEETWLNSLQVKLNWTIINTTWFKKTSDTSTNNVTIPKNSLPSLKNGNNTLNFKVIDKVWNETNIDYILKYDNTNPNWDISYSQVDSWVKVTIACTDYVSWCKQNLYTKIVSQQSTWIVTIKDNAWNTSQISYSAPLYDNTLPTWTVSYIPNTWTNWDVTINIACEDDNWCVQTNYQKTVSSNSNWIISIEDNIWNKADIPYNVTNIDKTIPTISIDCSNLTNNISNSPVECTGSMSNTWLSPDTLKYSHSTNRWDITWNWSSTNSENISYNYSNNWTYTINLEWSDKAWNTANSQTKTFTIDTSSPSISTSIDFNIWYNEASLIDYTFTLKDQSSTTNDYEETWLKSLQVKLNWNDILSSVTWFYKTSGISPIYVTVPKISLSSLQEKDNNTLNFIITDKVGNKTDVTYYIKYENTNPNWEVSYSQVNSWVKVNINCTDNLSWCKESPQITVSSNDTWTIIIEDNAWNTSQISYTAPIFDDISPTWNATYTPSTWTKWVVTVNSTCNDDNWCKPVTPILVLTNNNWTITIEDNIWNKADIPYNVTNIDKTIPTISIDCSNLTNNISNSPVECTGSMSNTWLSPDTLKYSHSTNRWDITWNWSSTNSENISYNYSNNWTYTINLEWSDKAWNTANSQTKTFTIDTSSPSISTSIDFNIWYNEASLIDYTFTLKDQRSTTNDYEETWLNSLIVKLNWIEITTTWFEQTSDTSPKSITIPKASLSSLIDGDNTLNFKITDKVGNITHINYNIKYDNINPSWEASYSIIDWWNVNIKITCTDTLSQCEENTYTKEVPINDTWYITIKDNSWNSNNIDYNTSSIDTIPPTIWYSIWWTNSSDIWANENVTISIKCSDNSWWSWCDTDSYQYKESDSSFTCDSPWWTWKPYSRSILYNNNWTKYICFKWNDLAWNLAYSQIAIIKVDKINPIISYSITWWTTLTNTWTNEDVTVSIDCSDNSWWSWCDTNTYQYRVSNSFFTCDSSWTWNNWSLPILYNTNWTRYICFKWKDLAWNWYVYSQIATIKIDTINPTISYSITWWTTSTNTWTNKDVIVSINCSDNDWWSWCNTNSYQYKESNTFLCNNTSWTRKTYSWPILYNTTWIKYICLRWKDLAWNWFVNSSTTIVKIDKDPVSSLDVSYISGWTNSDKIITIKAQDTWWSKLKKMILWQKENWWNWTSIWNWNNLNTNGLTTKTWTKSINNWKNYNYALISYDYAWNKSELINTNLIKFDITKPTISLNCDNINNNITNSKVTCTGSIWNNWPSTDTLIYSHSTSSWLVTWTWATINDNSNIIFSYIENWTYSINLEWYDEAWNIPNNNNINKTFTIDTSNPSISTDENFNIWYNKTSLIDYTFTLKDQTWSTDNFEETWLKSLIVKLNWNNISSSVTWFTPTNDISSIKVTIPKASLSTFLQEKIDNSLSFEITDNVWNNTTVTHYIKYDKTIPTLDVDNKDFNSWKKQNLNITLSTNDTWSSWLDYSKYILNDSSSCMSSWTDFSNGTTITLSEWTHTIYVCNKDHAWNENSSIFWPYNIDTTSPTLNVDNNNINSWQNEDLNIRLTTEDSGWSWLDYSKITTNNSSSCSTSWIIFSNNRSIALKEWEHTLYICNKDNAWNENSSTFWPYNIDTTSPTLKIINNWYSNNNINIQLKTNDLGWSWLLYSKYIWDNDSCNSTSWTDYQDNKEITLDLQWTHTLYICNEDKAWNKNSSSQIIELDSTPPEAGNITYTPDLPLWSTWTVIVNIECRDNDGWSWCAQDNYPLIVINNWNWIITIADNVWNTADILYNVTNIDDTPPSLGIWNNDYSWHNEDIKIKLTTSDELPWSWLLYSKYIWDNDDIAKCAESWTGYVNNEEITLSDEWEHTLYICNMDNAWNKNSTWSTDTFKLDKTPPTIDLSKIPNSKIAWNDNFNVKFTLKDNLSTNLTYTYNIIWDQPKSSTIPNTIAKDTEHDDDTYSLTDASEQDENFTISFNITDIAGNSNTVTKDFKIYPNFINEWHSSIRLNSELHEKYANNKDVYEYSINLKDQFENNIYNKKIDLIEQYISTYDQWKYIETNIIENTWINALIVEDISNSTSDENWIFNFNLKSLAPWEFTQMFKITQKNWWDDYIQNESNENSSITPPAIFPNNLFKKPYIWEIKVSNNNWITWEDTPQLFSTQKYKINLINTWSLDSYLNWTLNISNETIKNTIEWHIWQKDEWKIWISEIDNDFLDNSDENLVWFTWYIWINDENENDNANEIFPIIKTDELNISYKLWWENVKYELDEMEIIWTEILWVKIIWTLQWSWRAGLTWQDENFSEISSAAERWRIKKNAYRLISWMTSWQTVNGVRYQKWDIKINWDLNYETLVVIDWNVIISWDLNINDKKLWIIVLKDWYNSKIDYNNKWNVYITKDVTSINAIIYADWWLISTSSDSSTNSFTPYKENSITRTSDLEKQLTLKWTLFTRNTIGWAILWVSGKYILPWWINIGNTINDFNNAMIYDLNYLRRWHVWCNDTDNDWNCDYNDYFIIIYDSSVQSDPPKWFWN